MTTNEATLSTHVSGYIRWCDSNGLFFPEHKFFPEVLSGKKNAKRDAYCKYNCQALTALTPSLFIAGAISSVVASHVTKRVGRQAIMLIGRQCSCCEQSDATWHRCRVHVTGNAIAIQPSDECGWSSSLSNSPKAPTDFY